MNIALIGTIEESIPPKKYGGIEWIVYHLAHNLGLRGHTVDLYASGDSQQNDTYSLIPVVPQSLRNQEQYKEDLAARDMTKLLTMAQTVQNLKNKKYDIIHNHASWKFLLFSPFLSSTPLVTTHHNLFNKANGRAVFETYKNLPFISISNNQRKEIPDLNFVATVYNGLDIESFIFDEDNVPGTEAPMLFLARLTDSKGAIEAAETAHKTKKTVQFGAKVDMVYDAEYYKQFEKYIDEKYVKFLGELGLEKINYLQSSRCLLLPIKWEEPFGLMFIEAMATGTPVITFARGSAPEIVEDGVNGFLVNYSEDMRKGDFIIKKTGVEGLCEAVEKIYNMPEAEYKQMRKNARTQVEKKFTVRHMVDGYEAAFKKIIAER